MTDKDDVWSLDDQDDYYYDSNEEDFMEELYDTDSIDGDSNKNDWTWETFQKHTHILLPPLMPSNNKIAPPSYILHFVGGTLFGSYPLQFYKRILEQIAKLTNSVVVASSIPIVFNENPLNHNKISRRISNRFWNAYRYVIVDEYGQEAVETMKIVGLGHSLGARLMMLMSNKNLSTETATRSRNRKKYIDYDACIFISFNNYNALESIPGLAQLGQSIMENSYTQMERKKEAVFQRKQQERRQKSMYRNYYKERNGYNDYIGDDDNYDMPSKRKRRNVKSNTKYYTNDDDNDDDIGLNEVVAAVSDGIAEGIQDIKTAITPDLDQSDLEFQPTPQNLWDSIRSGDYVRNILLVQFDQDKIDQSSKLATIILKHETNIAKRADQEKRDTLNGTDVTEVSIESIDERTAQNVSIDSSTTSHYLRFARLKGTHLTPVIYSDSFVLQALKRTGTIDQILEEAIKEDSEYRPKSKSKRDKVVNRDLDALSKTISTYILDKV